MRYLEGVGLGTNKARLYRLWQFSSMNEFLDQSALSSGGTAHRPDDGTNWHGTASWEEAARLARNGWTAATSHLDGVLEAVRDRVGQIDGIHSVRTLDLIGADPDIDRYLSGEFECMWDWHMVEEPHEGRVFTVIVDGTSSSTVTSEDTMRRGAVVCSLLEAMATLGYGLNVWMEHTWRLGGSDDYDTLLVQVANAGEPLDIQRLMFAVGHTSWNRRIAFGAGQSLDRFKGTRFPNDARGLNGCQFAEHVGASIRIGLNTISRHTDPVAWVVNQLEAQGVIG